MNGIIFSTHNHLSLLPLTFMRPSADLRMGIFTFKERVEKLLGIPFTHLTVDYLQDKFKPSTQPENLFFNAAVFPTTKMAEKAKNLQENQALFQKETLIAFKGKLENFIKEEFDTKVDFKEEIIEINRPYDLFLNNGKALQLDFELIKDKRASQEIPETVQYIGDRENIFIEEGAKLSYCILNASKAPIYIGKDAEVMEGVMVRNGLVLCEGAKLNMGAKIYGATTIGTHSKVGGEVNNSILNDYSNKGHDGFLGNSVIGSWCNLGADTNNSNLKNNYGEVKLYNYEEEKFEETGQQFCGLMMGDHSKAAINTQFNTGTVVGVFSNIFLGGFPPRKIASFTWGGHKSSSKFKLEAAFEVAERMMSRRKVDLTVEDKEIITYLYNI